MWGQLGHGDTVSLALPQEVSRQTSSRSCTARRHTGARTEMRASTHVRKYVHAQYAQHSTRIARMRARALTRSRVDTLARAGGVLWPAGKRDEQSRGDRVRCLPHRRRLVQRRGTTARNVPRATTRAIPRGTCHASTRRTHAIPRRGCLVQPARSTAAIGSARNMRCRFLSITSATLWRMPQRRNAASG